jgi:hypothetical protein
MTAAITHLEVALDTLKTNRQVALNEGDTQKVNDYDVDILDIEASLEVLDNADATVDMLVEITRKMNRSFQIHVGAAAVIVALTLVGVIHVARAVFSFLAQ